MPVPPKRILLRVLIYGGSVAFVFALLLLTRGRKPRLPPDPSAANALEMLVKIEAVEAEKYWKPELEARARGKTFDTLWDRINRSDRKLAALTNVILAEIQMPVFADALAAKHGVQLFTPRATRTLASAEWRQFVQRSIEHGWQLERCEFRFIGLSPDTFYVSAHLLNASTEERAILEGNVLVEFNASASSIQRVDASKLELRTRGGAPPFQEIFFAEVRPPNGSYFIDPLIIWDLDNDGQLEVILAAANTVFRRPANGQWKSDRFSDHDPGLIFTGLLGDFDGDAITDFLFAKFEGLFLAGGTSDGRFPQPAGKVWTALPQLRYAQCLTAGDVDQDGDLDLFLGQYKLPYDGGQMPVPYFDANDGHPSFLLINDGRGHFSDQTQNSGLAAKRGRRVYSSTLLDLDSDRDLDLVLVSDFAGLDAFENDGTGRFSDATSKWFQRTAGLGMSQSFADFNRDGLLDVLMVGMNSPTADRLASVGLRRPYTVPDAGQRTAVTHGNRLFLGQPDGTFRETAASPQVARTGWSWGSAAGDLDNDGFPELYIANGHDSKNSVAEYEPEFWLHDIFIGNSRENSLAQSYYRQKFARTRGAGHSYGGYEKNRLFLNNGGASFTEVAHLFGVGLEQDSRNVALQDIDQDGKADLIVTTFEAHPKVRQTIRFYRNQLEAAGQSVQIILTDPKNTGASGKIVSDRTNAFSLASGESFRTQLPHRTLIGIGASRPATVRLIGLTNQFQVK